MPQIFETKPSGQAENEKSLWQASTTPVVNLKAMMGSYTVRHNVPHGILGTGWEMVENDSGATRASLILRVRSREDQAAWTEFVELYVPLIYGYARKQGLQDADASDVAQDVMTSINGAISRFDYNPQQGKFRGYLYTITRNQISKFWKKSAGKAGSGNTAVHALLDQTPAKENDEALWNEQHRWRLFQWATEKVQSEFTENTWQAFLLTSVEHKLPQEVAELLGISVGAVYIAKSRVIKRIRELVQETEDE